MRQAGSLARLMRRLDVGRLVDAGTGEMGAQLLAAALKDEVPEVWVMLECDKESMWNRSSLACTSHHPSSAFEHTRFEHILFLRLRGQYACARRCARNLAPCGGRRMMRFSLLSGCGLFFTDPQKRCGIPGNSPVALVKEAAFLPVVIIQSVSDESCAASLSLSNASCASFDSSARVLSCPASAIDGEAPPLILDSTI